MPMQHRVVHTTRFEYDGLASASYNQARMTPVTTPQQIVLHSRLEVSPKPWTSTYADYFGAQVIAFEVVDPHDAMTVTATSTVQVQRLAPVAPVLPWSAYAEREVADRWTEYLSLPPLVAPPADLVDQVRALADGGGMPGDVAREVCLLVAREVSFTPGSTDADSTAAMAWEQRAGVCQDLVHLSLGALRALGIPARYVSGYVHPVADPVIGETVEGDSRAWLEWWDEGWRAFDPCADTAPDNRYVSVAGGRDYHDVRPLHGIYSGAETSTMEVDVSITRTA